MKPRVLFILHFPPPVHGSAVIGQQIRESDLITERLDAHYINLGTSRTIDEIQHFAAGKIWRYLIIIARLVRELLFHRPRLCYLAITAEGAPFYKDALLALIVKLFSVQLVYHLHNKGVSHRQDHLADDLLYRLVFRNTFVILLSRHLYPDIQKYVPMERVSVCPNGIPPLIPLAASDRDNAEPQILFLSNMIASKGVYILLDACKLLHDQGISFHCTFVGGKGDVSSEQFDNYVKLNSLEGFVEYAGCKLGKEKDQFLANADIFAFPTFYEKETFGLVNLEAMQYALPIVSTREGGIPDVIKDGITGFLVPQRDSKALAGSLALLIGDSQLRETMGLRGRQHYRQHFTLRHFETNLLGILENIIQVTHKKRHYEAKTILPRPF